MKEVNVVINIRKVNDDNLREYPGMVKELISPDWIEADDIDEEIEGLLKKLVAEAGFPEDCNIILGDPTVVSFNIQPTGLTNLFIRGRTIFKHKDPKATVAYGKEIDIPVGEKIFKFHKALPINATGNPVTCDLLCPYANRCDNIPDPRDPEDKDSSFIMFCGELSETEGHPEYVDIVPIEGTVEEEFKKIGIDI